MKLPAIFEQDIKSKNIQLIPLLIIERDENWADFSYSSQSIFLSTHDININRVDGVPGASDSYSDGMYFSPLLLDNPVITEKIDVENRKYTISKCTFKVSNSVYNGSRFSDILTTDSLIGKKINFAYKSINSSFPVASQYFDATGNNTWGDVYDTYEYVSPTFYFGEIRDVKHTNESVSIVAEDLSSTYLHQQLPKNSLPNNSSVKEQYRGAKIPMVYGYMPRSPLVVGTSKKLYADSRPIQGFHRNTSDSPDRYAYPFNKVGDNSGDFGAVFTYIDDHCCNVADNISYRLADSTNPASQETYFNFSGYDEDDIRQISYQQDDIHDTTIAKFEANPLLSRNVAQLMVVYKPGKIALERRNQTVPFTNDMDEGDRITLGDGDNDWADSGYTDNNDLPMGGDQLTEEEFERMTDNDFSSEYLDAENDLMLSNWSEAQINNADYWLQLYYNRWKHSMFRFVIDTEPPITFLNRGGASTAGGYGLFNHWIAFGHWVMPEQHNTYDFPTSSFYTTAKFGTYDNSADTLGIRYILNRNDEQEDMTHAVYQPNEEITDSWGAATYLGDIVRFSDYHDSGTYGEYNPRRIQWSNYEFQAKSPLEFFGLECEDETGTFPEAFPYSYTNPYAKFTNRSSDGRYIIELGVFGVRHNSDLLFDGSDYYANFNAVPSGISYNFTYRANMRGWLPETTCMSVCDTKMDFKDMYGSVVGRKASDEGVISHPADIIADIFINELGYSENMLDQVSLDESKQQNSHQNWLFSFTQRDEINSKELIEDIAKSTFMFPRIGFDGTLKFPQIKRKYTEDDLDKSMLIEGLDVIKYSYGLTKRQELRTGTELKYNYDHKNDSYFGDVDSKNHQGISIINQTLVSEEHLNQDGLDNIEDNIKEFESKYMRSDDITSSSPEVSLHTKTMRDFEHMSTHHYRNRHLTIKLQLPLRYLNIEVGDYVRFDKLLDGVRAYGIDYTAFTSKNNQYIYPLFLCVSIKKSIEYVELECLQLHHLWFMDDPLGVSQPDEIWLGSEWEEGEIEEDPVGGEEEEPEEEPEEEEEYAWDVFGTCVVPEVPAIGQPGGYINNISEAGCMMAGDGAIFTPHPPELEVIVPAGSGNGVSFAYDTFNLDYMQQNNLLSYPYEIVSQDGVDGEVLRMYNEDHAQPFKGFHKLFSPSNFYIRESEGQFPVDPGGDDWIPLYLNATYSNMHQFYQIFPYDLVETTATSYQFILLSITHHTYSDDGYAIFRSYLLRNIANIGENVQLAWEFWQPADLDVLNYASPYEDPLFPGDTFAIDNRSDIELKYVSPHGFDDFGDID